MLIKPEITVSCPGIKKSTKFFCTEGKDVTKLPVSALCPSCQCSRTWYWWIQLSARVGIMKECQSQIFKHLGSMLTSALECFHLCYWRTSVKPGLSSLFEIPFKGKPLCGSLGSDGFSCTPRACQCCLLFCSRLLRKMQQIWYLLSAGFQHNLLL